MNQKITGVQWNSAGVGSDAEALHDSEPYVLRGYYDEHGNYIPGYFDDRGEYHLGYGYWSDEGEWMVAHGYYDPNGEWVEKALTFEPDPAFAMADESASIEAEVIADRIPAFQRNRTLPYLMASAAAHILFIIMALTIPASPDSLELDQANLDDRFVQLVLMPEQDDAPEESSSGFDDIAGEEGRERAAGAEGKAGTESAEATDRRMAIQGDSNERKRSNTEHNREVAMDSGVLAVTGGGSFDPFGTNDTNVGADAIAALGGVDGEQVGDTNGVGGLGITDAGRGGGGDDESVGIDLDGKVCPGGVCKSRCKFKDRSKCGKGRGDLPVARIEKDEKTPEAKFIPGKLVTRDCMSRDQIASVVRRRRNEIRACYERQLQRNPTLAGGLSVHFKIGSTGAVILATVKSSSIKNRALEQCVQNKIRRWVFPEPQGCAMVNVTYPFNFKR